MELLLIRHAQSTNNALPDPENGRVCDPPLTELGWRQAEQTARYLAKTERGIVELYCSPMYRALQTAALLGRALGLRPHVWVDLHEHGGIYLDHGAAGRRGYPGKSRREILAEWPEFILPVEVTDAGWYTGGFEELEICRRRAQRVAAALARRACEPGVLALVVHGTFMSELLSALLGAPDPPRAFFLHCNTGLSRLVWREDGLFVSYLNRVDHLPTELVS